ncbi:MAG: class I SAM-dependent methyltransferase, partial [Candidatus Cybelea sp.]
MPARGAERFVFCINDAGALRALAPPVDLAAGRAFAAGRIDVRGDLECAFDMVVRAAGALTPLRKMKLLFELQSLPGRSMPPLREATLHGRPHSHVRDRSAIAHHYDRPVEFYANFLDPELLYSCAYFDENVETLAGAQIAKVDYILRKLRLRSGERFLDVGCGWGALVLA